MGDGRDERAMPTSHFRHAVVARVRLSPGPSTANEAQYLYERFRELAPNLEVFSIPRDPSRTLLFLPRINMIYTYGVPMLDDPFDLEDKAESIEENVQFATKQLSLIVALPRFSYIENDPDYESGRTAAPFKWSLTEKGRAYDGKFEVTLSTVSNPFVHLKTTEDRKAVTHALRHNFQKFHKFDVHVEHGPETALRLLHQLLPKKKKTS